MKKNLLIMMVISAGFLSCHRDCPADMPVCVQEWISLVKKEAPWNPAAEVDEYHYNGKTVYLMQENCCDQYNTLIDDQCNYPLFTVRWFCR